MSTVYLNGEYLPLQEARISPMDRGFLFGDGIYELIPTYDTRMIAFEPHVDRMNSGLKTVGIDLGWQAEDWRELCTSLIKKNPARNLAIYLHVTRGVEDRRSHAYSQDISPTVFAYTYEINEPIPADASEVTGFRVATSRDLRWDHCDIKSTALLGNVMHFQQGYEQGYNETLLFNDADELTEASSSNAWIVKDGLISTPPLDKQILPGVTRQILLDMLRRDGGFALHERVIGKSEVLEADEIWLSSSSRGLVPVVQIDNAPVADGCVGQIWERAYKLYTDRKFDY